MKVIRISALWCMSCMIMYERTQALQEEFGIDFIDLDIDQDDVSNYNIERTLPVLIFLDENNEEIGRLIGEISKKKLRKYVASL